MRSAQKRFLIYYLIGCLYLVLVHQLGFGPSWAAALIKGVPDYKVAILSALYVFFFELVLVLPIFDYSRAQFYHEQVTQLYRTGSRVRALLIVISHNCALIAAIMVGLYLTGALLDGGIDRQLLLLALVQLFALLIQAVLQTIIEIKVSSLAALYVLLVTVLGSNLLHLKILGFIHTNRLVIAAGSALLWEGLALVLVIAVSAVLIRRQEIY